MLAALSAGNFVATSVNTYLLSLLVAQFLAKESAFLERHPGAWLVWEPGAWAPPANPPGKQSTKLPSEKATVPTTDDALCFELPSNLGTLAIGRSSENALVINDATVSRAHLALHFSESTWSLEPLAGAKDCQLDGSVVNPGERKPLQSGAKVQLGHVQLTFLDAQGLRARVAAGATKLRR